MENQVEVVKQQGLVVPVKGRGFSDDFDQSDYLIPRAKIIQFVSNETKDPDETKRIPAGRFINSVSKTEIPKVFIPIIAYKTYVRFNPLDSKDPRFDKNFEAGKLIFTTRDRHDPRVVEGIAWGDNGEKPLVQKVLNYLCFFAGENFPLILSFKSTSYKGAQRLNTLLESAGGDLFSNRYRILITTETKAGNSYYVLNVEAAGKSTPEEYAICESLYNRFSNKDVESMAHQEEAIVTPEDTNTGW